MMIFTRAWDQIGSQFWIGAGSSYRSMADLIDGDGYFSAPDLVAANTMGRCYENRFNK